MSTTTTAATGKSPLIVDGARQPFDSKKLRVVKIARTKGGERSAVLAYDGHPLELQAPTGRVVKQPKPRSNCFMSYRIGLKDTPDVRAFKSTVNQIELAAESLLAEADGFTDGRRLRRMIFDYTLPEDSNGASSKRDVMSFGMSIPLIKSKDYSKPSVKGVEIPTVVEANAGRVDIVDAKGNPAGLDDLVVGAELIASFTVTHVKTYTVNSNDMIEPVYGLNTAYEIVSIRSPGPSFFQFTPDHDVAVFESGALFGTGKRNEQKLDQIRVQSATLREESHGYLGIDTTFAGMQDSLVLQTAPLVLLYDADPSSLYVSSKIQLKFDLSLDASSLTDATNALFKVIKEAAEAEDIKVYPRGEDSSTLKVSFKHYEPQSTGAAMFKRTPFPIFDSNGKLLDRSTKHLRASTKMRLLLSVTGLRMHPSPMKGGSSLATRLVGVQILRRRKRALVD